MDKEVDLWEINRTGFESVLVQKLSSKQGLRNEKNFLKSEYVRLVVELLHGTIVECNAVYAGARDTTEKHRKLIHDHGWNIMPEEYKFEEMMGWKFI